MTILVVCDDPELRDLVTRVALQADLPVLPSDPAGAKRAFAERASGGVFAAASALLDDDVRRWIGSVERVVVATAADQRHAEMAPNARTIRLPTSLDRLETMLRWLAGGDQDLRQPPGMRSSSASA